MEQEDLRRPFAVAPDGPARSRGVVGGYRLERMIGRGGAAEVYLARRMSDEARFAVKVVIAGSRSLADRAEVEGTIQKLLQHPNLVPVHELLKVDGLPALVMEYVEGPSLAEWLADRGPLELSEAVGLFRDILAGVRAAHAAGLVHRDLKPANILLATDAQGRVVPKVTDFGLAKLIGLRGPTMIGTAMGTPEYAAPEQGRDASSVDVRADLYALGCILYELLAGNGPFAGLDPFRLILARRSGAIGRSRRSGRTCPRRWRSWSTSCCPTSPTSGRRTARWCSGGSTPSGLGDRPKRSGRPRRGGSSSRCCCCR